MLFKIFKYIQFLLNTGIPFRNKNYPKIVEDLISDIFVFMEFPYEEKIRSLRQKIKNDKIFINNISLGAPSKLKFKYKLSAAEIMKFTGVSHKTGKLLFALAKKFEPSTILELGTGIGISTFYLALGYPGANIVTIEGSQEKSDYAKNLLHQEGFTDIQFYTGNFDDLLPLKIVELTHPLLVFIDGNHRYSSTIEYYNILINYANDNTIIIFDDIYWSKEMERAWRYISVNENVRISIDTFYSGIIFFNRELPKQQIKLNF